MPSVRTLARSFNAGEITPEMFGRIDDVKYQTGLALCLNFITTPHGPAVNRPGTAFVRAVKNSAKRTRLIPFAYSTTQTMVIEIGENYMRFHTAGATLVVGTPAAWDSGTAYTPGDLVSFGGVNYVSIAAGTNHSPPDGDYWYAQPSDAYEIPTEYLEADLFDIHYVQSADVLTLVHPNYAPRELRREGATNLKWSLRSIVFASTLVPPTSVNAVATVTGTGLTDQTYVVTSVATDGVDESLISISDTCSNNLNAVGAFNTITWTAAANAARYNVYKLDNGLYGFIGQTQGVSFVDDNITPNIGKTPPEMDDPFVGAGNYPGAVSYYEQRRGFAGTLNQPQNFWLTRSGTESNLTYSIPQQDADAISYRVATRENNTIRHLVPLSDLILLTSSAEMRVFSTGGALTAATTAVKPQSWIGASNVQPSIVNNNLVFAAARGGHVREFAYANESGGYLTGDMSLRAPHLFDGYEIVDMTYAKSPQPVLWFVSTSGLLLGMTYVPEQNVGAWHRHSTHGVFESVTAVAEGTEDAVYVVVQRTINGSSVRYVERFASRRFATPADAFFVDAGVTYSGAPVTTISAGLGHLEGETVSILGDGAVRPPQVVTGGSITLDQPASKLQIGLAYNSDLQTLPAAFEAQAFGQGRQKNVNAVWMRVNQSAGWSVGPTFDRLTEAKIRTTEPYGSPPSLRSGEVKTVVGPDWQDDGFICIRQANPLPLIVVSMTMELAVGG